MQTPPNKGLSPHIAQTQPWNLAFVALFTLVWTYAATAQSRPNIVFFLADEQRSDCMGCAGHPFLRTPTMDSLARQGTRFTNAFATTSICAAGRASILTGLVERTHGYTFGTLPIKTAHSQISYPALLKEAGYRTGFVGKFGVAVEPGQREIMFDSFAPLSRSPISRRSPTERNAM